MRRSCWQEAGGNFLSCKVVRRRKSSFSDSPAPLSDYSKILMNLVICQSPREIHIFCGNLRAEIMDLRTVCWFFAVLASAKSHPTLYKLNENKVLEADLVPVSSTVIPLPIYHVSSGLNFGTKDEKVVRPVGPITLITSSNKKKSYPKAKSDEVSIVKEVNEKEFKN